MTKFILSRFLQAIVGLLAVTLITFVIVRLIGDPVTTILPIDATREQIEDVRKSLGLDQPLWKQYEIYMSGLLHGDLGTSIKNRQPVSELIRERLPATLQLGLVSLAITFFTAIPLGVYAAARKGSFIDWGARILAILGQSIPVFWLAIILIQVFAVQLGILPPGGRGSWNQLVLPSVTLGIFLCSGLVRLTRSSMLEVLESDYVKMARAKGVSEQVVLWKHAFRNAAIPVLTFSALLVVAILTGAVIVETVFAWPGLGRLVVDSVRSRDLTVVQGVIFLFAAFYIMANLVVDLMYAYLNPRIRF